MRYAPFPSWWRPTLTPSATAHPSTPVAATAFGNGINTWDLDAIGVTDLGSGRSVTSDGSGVYVAVLDTGLVDQWRKG